MLVYFLVPKLGHFLLGQKRGGIFLVFFDLDEVKSMGSFPGTPSPPTRRNATVPTTANPKRRPGINSQFFCSSFLGGKTINFFVIWVFP